MDSNSKDITKFFGKNNFNESQKQMIKTLFAEANENNFIVKIGNAK